ncbi:MAG: 30S ribosomal protein S7 [Okeania sp. SIO2H7]|nr:30S ribosomal protein S7 [Okeania sp. SIO2H7]
MSRRNISKKRFPEPDSLYNSYLVNLLILRILKSGKKNIAKNIVYQAFEVIKIKTKQQPLVVFEKAIRNASPLVEVKSRRVGGSTYQVPVEVKAFKSTTLALRWIISYSHQRVERTMALKLANEIIDTYNKTGNTIKKKAEVHRIADSNKAFAHFRY